MSSKSESGLVPEPETNAHLSYKYQRLRERIRESIQSGRLTGRLPGERELARQLHSNPKTLSKALSDLAAEGLLDRSIGRGTFVRGSDAAKAGRAGKWLILCDEQDRSSVMVRLLEAAHEDAVVETSVELLRPSFIGQFKTVIDLCEFDNLRLHRNLRTRGIDVLRLGHEPGGIQLHAVMLDRVHAAWRLARDLFLAGNMRVGVLMGLADGQVINAIRHAADRYNPEAWVWPFRLDEITRTTVSSLDALLCLSTESIVALMSRNPHVHQINLAAMGICDGPAPCRGIYVTSEELIGEGLNLLASAPGRPGVIYLTGTQRSGSE